MRLLFIHGLESNSIKPDKLKYLDSLDTVTDIIAPIIKWKTEKPKEIWDKLIKHINSVKPDYIIGSSIGGYTAYCLGNHLKIKTILFNPSLKGNSINLVFNFNKNNIHHKVVLSENDTTVDNFEVLKYLNDNNDNFDWFKIPGGHQVKLADFKKGINWSLSINETNRIINFNEFIKLI